MTGAPLRRLMTCEEFERAGTLGLYGPEERLELIDGEVYAKAVPMNWPHAFGISASEAALRIAFPAGYHIRVQLPLVFGTYSEPEPDVAVITGTLRDYIGGHPTAAVLVVEIADSTLAFDRNVKAALYARAEILEYWIVNLNDRLLEVHRQPVALPTPHYRSVTRHAETDTIAPLLAPHAVLAVASLLP